eukprot:TRINITY_DN8417_c0_g2_i1.p1 TRINITY_DN8417_c0_g2~~TRINITY_DN8417_c0_g2_i1.p1  ORF type:complete len:278 (-),score=60.06 TRINITY_DN8417_c0_g2_i1:16-849(-)
MKSHMLQGSRAALVLCAATLLPASGALMRGRARQAAEPEEQSLPDPTVVWVDKAFVQPGLPRPDEESCFGCQCMNAFPGLWLSEGTITPDYTCEKGKTKNLIPDIRWGGPKDGQKCRSCQSFAMTIEDLDFPNGMGSPDNHIHNIFWIANIPGDWMALNETAVTELGELAPAMVLGRNSKGEAGMEAPCPGRGLHRYRVTMWSLDSNIEDISPDYEYHSLMQELTTHELARATFHAQLSANRFVAILKKQDAQASQSPATAAAPSPAAAAAPSTEDA